MDGFQGWAGVVATLLPDKGDRISGPNLSYYKATFQGAEICRKTGARSVALQVQPQIYAWSARSRVRIQHEESFSPSLQSRDNDRFDVPILAQWNLIVVNVRDFQ